jgi:hypothetical protein
MKVLLTFKAGQKEEQFSDSATCNRCGPGSIPVQSIQNSLLYNAALRVRPIPLSVALHWFCMFIDLYVAGCRMI